MDTKTVKLLAFLLNQKMRKAKLIFLIILLIGVVAKSDVVLPYAENFDGKQIGSSFEDWSHPLGEILGPGSTPFGENIPFSGNYLFISGSQGQSASTAFSEITNNANFNLDFYSLPNPGYVPPGAFRGGADFFITADSAYARAPRVGVGIFGEMWQNPSDIDVYFKAEYLDGSSIISIPIGTIGHGESYHLSIALNQDIVNVYVTSPSTNINYEYALGGNFPANGVMIWEGSYPANEYGVGIDNMLVTPEPTTFLLLTLGCGFLLRKRV
jgi:hypothetical protein